MTTHKKTNKKKTTSTKTNDIATQNLTPNPVPEPTANPTPVDSSPLPPGARANLPLLQGEATGLLRLAALYAAGLTAARWTPQRTQQLEQKLLRLTAAYATFGHKQEARKEVTLHYRSVVADSILFRNQMVAALRVATRGKKNPFTATGLQLTQTNVPAKLVTWFTKLLALAEAHRAALKEQLNADPVQLVQQYADRLSTAIATQKTSTQDVRALAKTKTAARIELAEAMSELRFAATIAFQRDKAVLARFAPSWNRVPQAKKTTGPQAGSGGTSAPLPSSTEAAAAVNAPAATKTAAVPAASAAS